MKVGLEHREREYGPDTGLEVVGSTSMRLNSGFPWLNEVGGVLEDDLSALLEYWCSIIHTSNEAPIHQQQGNFWQDEW